MEVKNNKMLFNSRNWITIVFFIFNTVLSQYDNLDFIEKNPDIFFITNSFFFLILYSLIFLICY